MLPALNRSEPGLVESLQRRMGCRLECFKESPVVILSYCRCQSVMQRWGLGLYTLQEI